MPKVKELRVIINKEWFSQALRDKSDQGTRVICSQRIRQPCLPKGSVTIRSAKALIEKFKKFENVEYYLKQYQLKEIAGNECYPWFQVSAPRFQCLPPGSSFTGFGVC